MHPSAFSLAIKFFRDYAQAPRIVVEIGSMDVNGNLRALKPANCLWLGLDKEWGPGVDVRMGQSIPLGDNFSDVTLASSVFEHDPCFWHTFIEMVRITQPGGYIYVNAPSNGPVHRHPVDCWRFYPDAARALASWAYQEGYSTELCESKVMEEPSQGWLDFYAIYQRI